MGRTLEMSETRAVIGQSCGRCMASWSALSEPNAAYILVKLSGMTVGSYIRMGHRSKTVSHKLSKWEAAGYWAAGPVWVMLSWLMGVQALRMPSRSSLDARSAG